MGVSTSAEVAEGLRPFEPCELLKKLEQNLQNTSAFVFAIVRVSGESVAWLFRVLIAMHIAGEEGLCAFR